MIQWLWYQLLQVPIALAVTGNPGGGTSITLPNPIGCDDASCVLNKVIDIVFTFAIPVTAVMILIGGFQMVTAAGDSEKFGKGVKTLKYAVIGFAIVLLAKSVVPVIQSIFS